MLTTGLTILSLSGLVAASFYGGTSVVELTGKTFDSQVFGDTNVWMVRRRRRRGISLG